MKRKLLHLAAPGFAALLVVGLLGTADTVRADFNPELTVTVDNPEPEANSDYTIEFGLPSDSVNFGGVVAFVPVDWGAVPGDEIPIGAAVGELTAEATLGIVNSACNTTLPVEFTMLNSSIDPTDTVDFLDSDDNGTEDFADDKDNSGLQDAIEKYSDFINRVLVDEDDQPLTPLRRAAGTTIVAGINVLLQFLLFEPGTFINENISNDSELGYPTVTLLQNAGDPDFDPIPGPITDFCAPLSTFNTTSGETKDNPNTDADEGGVPLFFNPQDGTYTFTTISVGLRDADGDGIENSLDTCNFVANVGDPRETRDGDDDGDGLDAACDPNDDETNSDEDLDGYTNRQDNCPLDANGEESDNQRDTDNDLIGDACDPNPDNADTEGELVFSTLVQEIIIGTGTGEGGPPTNCPNCFGGGDGNGGAPSETGDDDDGGGLSTGALIGIIAGVIVLGGGAFFAMRGRGGGGEPA